MASLGRGSLSHGGLQWRFLVVNFLPFAALANPNLSDTPCACGQFFADLHRTHEVICRHRDVAIDLRREVVDLLIERGRRGLKPLVLIVNRAVRPQQATAKARRS